MKRASGIAFIVCLFVGGTAYAGRGGHGGGGRVGVRDHRGGGGGGWGGGGPAVRDHRGGGGGGRARVHMSGGRYLFPGGVVRVYRRPVIREHYYNVHMRPSLIVESYDPVPGYVWVGGNWTWGGAEWVWNPGYWAPAAEPSPVIGGGVSVSAGISL